MSSAAYCDGSCESSVLDIDMRIDHAMRTFSRDACCCQLCHDAIYSGLANSAAFFSQDYITTR